MKINKAILRFTFLVLGCFIFSIKINAQDFPGMYQQLKDRFKNDPLRITGGISSNFDFLTSSDSLRNQTPFNYRFAANLNIDLMGINIPLSANFSNAKTVYNYQLPAYSFVGLSPTYKWATLHLGDRSMQFSPYTLSGQNFYGVGTELTPGKFRFQAMYGRLRKAIQEDIGLNGQGPEPSYLRKGWGVKAGFDKGRSSYDIILFHAKDDPNSIDSLINHPTLRPQENLVIGFNSKQQLWEKINFSVEYAMSAFTQDINVENKNLDNQSINSIYKALGFNISTSFSNALNTSLGYQLSQGVSFQINYERVDPGYRTLGALYFNDNMENYTASTKASLFKRKLNLSSNIGVQRNNLDGTQVNSSLRLVGAINANYVVSDRINLNTSYSNFRNTNIRDVSIESLQNNTTNVNDYNITSFITQISQSANLSVSYSMGAQKKSNLSTLFSYQKSYSIENNQVLLDQQTTYYTSAITHSYLMNTINMTMSSSFMINYGLIPTSNILSLTPTVAITKSLMKKTLQINSSFSYATAYAGEQVANKIFSSQLGIRFNKFKDHPIGLNVRYTNRPNISGITAISGLSEFTASLSYNYRFSPKLKRNKK